MSLAPRPCTAPSAIRPGRLPCAGTVSTWPARAIGAAASPQTSASPSSYRGSPGRRLRTSSMAGRSRRLSEGTSTSSRVRAARSEMGMAGVIMTAGWRRDSPIAPGPPSPSVGSSSPCSRKEPTRRTSSPSWRSSRAPLASSRSGRSSSTGGYPNAGKATLLNALTDAGVSVRDRLFETLDPVTRGFEQEGRRYLVTDTVGFVRRLPHQLVEGFAATLEETLVADLVLHVVDGSAPEQRLVEQIAAVDAVLREIGANDLPVDLVVNKIDAVDTPGRRRLANRYPDAPQISALTGEGLEELRARIAERFGDRFERVRLLLPYEEGRRLNELYALGAPIDEREDTAEGVLVVARLPRRELRRFAPYLVAEEAPRRRRTGA